MSAWIFVAILGALAVGMLWLTERRQGGLSLRQRVHAWRHATCSTCGREFRKSRPSFPSLVGFSYCSYICEGAAWAKWIKGGAR